MSLRRGVAFAYYGGLIALMVLIIPSWLAHILPATVAHHISYDSEGYILAILLPAWIQWVRPALKGRKSEWPVTLSVGATSLLICILLYNTHILSTIKTLNETFFALALLIPYVQLRRPLARFMGLYVCAGALIATIIAEQTSQAHVTTALAEGVVMLILAPIGFDVLDRGILQRGAQNALRERVGWCVALAAMSLLVIELRRAGVSGDVGVVLNYAGAAQEAFVGLLLVHVYFLIGPAGASAGLKYGSAPHARRASSADGSDDTSNAPAAPRGDSKYTTPLI
jgi:hypothetical protein